MSDNAKNRLLNLFQKHGWPLPTFRRSATGPPWQSSLDMVLPNGRVLQGSGSGWRGSDADVSAAEAALATLEPDAESDDVLWHDAQRGDALIKLAAYLGLNLPTPAAKSEWLQTHEADDHLAGVLKDWSDSGDVVAQAHLGGRGSKHRATVVEALIWRRFHSRVLAPGAVHVLTEIATLLSANKESPSDD